MLTIWLTRMPPPISLPEIMWDKKLFIHGICAISPKRIKRQKKPKKKTPQRKRRQTQRTPNKKAENRTSFIKNEGGFV